MATYYSTNLINNSTGTVLANGFQSTLLSSIQSLITDIANNTTYTATANAGNASNPNNLLDFEFKISSEDCTIHNLALKVFTANTLTPTTPITNYGTHILTLLDPGNCSTRVCFTADELEDLYQQALNMCKLCNCI